MGIYLQESEGYRVAVAFVLEFEPFWCLICCNRCFMAFTNDILFALRDEQVETDCMFSMIAKARF